jgi:hypothetical protein
MYTTFIDKFNIMGITPRIYMNSKRTYLSNFSFAISMLTILTVTAFAIYFAISILSRFSYITSISKNVELKPYSDLSKLPMMFYLFPSDTSKVYTEPERLYNLTGNVMEFLTYPNGTKQRIITQLYFDRCEYEKLGEYKNLFEKYKDRMNNFFCLYPDKYNFSLYGYSGNDANNSLFNIYLNRCINGTNNNKNNCYSSEYQKSELTVSFFQLISLEHQIDSDNYTHPLQIKAQPHTYFITNTLYKRFIKYYKGISYHTEDGVVFSNTWDVEGFQEDYYETIVDQRVGSSYPGQFTNICFYMSGSTDVLKRTYYKLQTAVANIGGAAQFISIVAKFIITMVCENFYFHSIASKFTNDEDSAIGIHDKTEISAISNKLQKINTQPYQTTNQPEINKSSTKNINTFNRTGGFKFKLKKKVALFPLWCLSKMDRIDKEKMSYIKKIVKRALSVDFIFYKFEELTALKKLYIEKFEPGTKPTNIINTSQPNFLGNLFNIGVNNNPVPNLNNFSTSNLIIHAKPRVYSAKIIK